MWHIPSKWKRGDNQALPGTSNMGRGPQGTRFGDSSRRPCGPSEICQAYVHADGQPESKQAS